MGEFFGRDVCVTRALALELIEPERTLGLMENLGLAARTGREVELRESLKIVRQMKRKFSLEPGEILAIARNKSGFFSSSRPQVENPSSWTS